MKKANTGFNIKTLKGKKSCHTGIRRNAGWNIPIGYLLRSKIMLAVACGNDNNDYMSASKFFSESCLPGKDKTLTRFSDHFTGLISLKSIFG